MRRSDARYGAAQREQLLAGHVGELAADDHDPGRAGREPLQRRRPGVDLVEPVAPGDHAAQPLPGVGVTVGEQQLVAAPHSRRPQLRDFVPRMWQSTTSLANAVGNW